jgi:hypothetical protein
MTLNNKELCLALMRADTQDEVVSILTDAGHWDDPTAWRWLGDAENNFSAIGNQQSEAVAALIEKLVNSVDARLMNAAACAGIDAEGDSAPKSIRDAVARLYEGKAAPKPDDGRIATWDSEKATKEGRLLTLSATGNMPDHGRPSLTIADQGEGQEPDRWPDTFMSLQRSNKLRIQFVQGKFNMGGTGALQFCGGRHKLQLIISRRNPFLLPAGSSARAGEWGFTIVRRQEPQGGARSSVFTYLAPHGAAAGTPGGVLSFAAESWPIFPEADAKVRDAYARESEYGSLVKLYEYEWSGTKSNIVSSGGGLLRRIDSGLPELALPIRVFECRPGYRGGTGSFATNVLGLSARLEKDKAEKLEPDFPVGHLINIGGSQVKAMIYAFKPGEAKNYRTARQGVVFSLNGQSHATFANEFYRRKSVGMSYLADSLFVLVDCSSIDGADREDLFMNSRDRLRDTALARELEADIETLVKEDVSLKALRNSRRAKDLEEKLEDSKPLGDILQTLLKNSPTLSKLFLLGMQVPSPFPPGGGAGEGAASAFEGKPYPTFFRFRGLGNDEPLFRDANIGSRTRLALETDAEDMYFVREIDPGVCRLLLEDDDGYAEITGWKLTPPKSGIAHLSLDSLPADAEVGDLLNYRIEITDPSRIDAFRNDVTLKVLPSREDGGGGSGDSSSSKNTGSGGTGGSNVLALPNVIPVPEQDWELRGMNELSALHIKHAGDGADGSEHQIYDFYVNVDNKYLKTAQKEAHVSVDPKLLKAQFQYALVLLGLGLLQDEKHITEASAADSDEDDGAEPVSMEHMVDLATRAVAPILLPMIDALGHLSLGDEPED